nr:hypothetical protein [Leuven wasp-associated virus 6]
MGVKFKVDLRDPATLEVLKHKKRKSQIWGLAHADCTKTYCNLAGMRGMGFASCLALREAHQQYLATRARPPPSAPVRTPSIETLPETPARAPTPLPNAQVGLGPLAPPKEPAPKQVDPVVIIEDPCAGTQTPPRPVDQYTADGYLINPPVPTPTEQYHPHGFMEAQAKGVEIVETNGLTMGLQPDFDDISFCEEEKEAWRQWFIEGNALGVLDLRAGPWPMEHFGRNPAECINVDRIMAYLASPATKRRADKARQAASRAIPLAEENQIKAVLAQTFATNRTRGKMGTPEGKHHSLVIPSLANLATRTSLKLFEHARKATLAQLPTTPWVNHIRQVEVGGINALDCAQMIDGQTITGPHPLNVHRFPSGPHLTAITAAARATGQAAIAAFHRKRIIDMAAQKKAAEEETSKAGQPNPHQDPPKDAEKIKVLDSVIFTQEKATPAGAKYAVKIDDFILSSKNPKVATQWAYYMKTGKWLKNSTIQAHWNTVKRWTEALRAMLTRHQKISSWLKLSDNLVQRYCPRHPVGSTVGGHQQVASLLHCMSLNNIEIPEHYPALVAKEYSAFKTLIDVIDDGFFAVGRTDPPRPPMAADKTFKPQRTTKAVQGVTSKLHGVQASTLPAIPNIPSNIPHFIKLAADKEETKLHRRNVPLYNEESATVAQNNRVDENDTSPQFKADMQAVKWRGNPKWLEWIFGKKVANKLNWEHWLGYHETHETQADVHLTGLLASEVAFKERTPQLRLTLMASAMRHLHGYSLQGYTALQIASIAMASVSVAFAGVPQEHALMRIMHDSAYTERVKTLNKHILAKLA